MKNNILYITTFFLLSVFFSALNAQDLLSKLEKELPENPEYVLATFKTTRINIGHSVETRKKGSLELSVINRYWNIPNINTQRFLADKVNIRFAAEYAVSDRFTFGFGSSTFDRLHDGTLKYRLIRQRTGKKAPLSITLLQNVSYNTNRTSLLDFSDKLAYTTQVLIARKFSPKLSAQIAPTFVHRSSAIFSNDPNNQFAIGFGGRYKVGHHTSIVSEYYYVANPITSVDTFNAFSVGVNWEVSNLLLQFNITNARNVVEDAFITKTRNNFNFHDGNFHFGFSATLVLHTQKNKLN